MAIRDESSASVVEDKASGSGLRESSTGEEQERGIVVGSGGGDGGDDGGDDGDGGDDDDGDDFGDFQSAG